MIPRETYRIASFNIRRFSNPSVFHNETKDSKKLMDIIAKIVHDNDIDILAIQEISGKDAFKELLSAIAYGYVKDITASVREEYDKGEYGALFTEDFGGDYLACEANNWQGRWAHPHSKWGTAISEEGYAFIWNTSKFELPTNKRGRVQPVIKHKKESYFVRPPFYGRFITRNILVKFEIRLLNTHVLYTKDARLKKLKDTDIDIEQINSDDKSVRMQILKELRESGLTPLEIQTLKQFANQDDIERRRSEVNNLVKEILSREEDKDGLSSYAFLLGDYNLNLSTSTYNYANRRATIDESIIYGGGKYDRKEYVITQSRLSTLRTPPKLEKDPENKYDQRTGDDRLSNNYDHFTYNANLNGENGRDIYVSEPVTIDAMEKYGITNREYYERVSDHLPIMIEIGF